MALRHARDADGPAAGPERSDAGADRRVGPTGRRLRATSPEGRTVVEIAQVGAALRRLAVDGVEHVPPYPDDIPTPAASGLVLVPWPNRVRDGEWTWQGESLRLAVTEPKLGNASHGLLRFTAYEVADEQADAVTLAAHVYPQTGWPFHLATEVTYRAVEDGVEVGHRIVNAGGRTAPVALGAHPYVQIGGVDTADLEITLPAETCFQTDERSIPVSQAAVDEVHDLRSPRRLGDLDLDTAYGDIRRDADDRIRAVLTAPDGRSVTVWMGPGFDFCQVFTTDRYPGHPLAVAVEPMTAPANALATGHCLHHLEPGDAWELAWGIRIDAAASGSAAAAQETPGLTR